MANDYGADLTLKRIHMLAALHCGSKPHNSLIVRESRDNVSWTLSELYSGGLPSTCRRTFADIRGGLRYRLSIKSIANGRFAGRLRNDAGESRCKPLHRVC